jgi:uncharacterized protein
MNPTFLSIAHQGRNGWKHYLVGILLLFSIALISIALIIIISAQLSGISISNREGGDLLLHGNPFRTLAHFGLIGVAILLGLFLVVQRVHKRKFLTLISPDASFCWQRVVKGFGVWLSLYGTGFLIWYLIVPSRYVLTFNVSEWLPFALFALIIVPILSLAFALFYAYLLQGTGLLLRKPLFLLIVWGFIYGSLSGAKMPIDWILNVVNWMFITWIIIKDNRLELTIGLLIARSIPSLEGV